MERNEMNVLDNDGSPCLKKRRKQKSYRKKVEEEWSHENILKLIQEIEARPCLWDFSCAEYKMPKEIFWQEVADSVDMSINECKGKWSNLRTTFKSNLNKHRTQKSGQAENEPVSIAWKYFKQMRFLEAIQVSQSTRSTSFLQSNSVGNDYSFARNLDEGSIESQPSTQKQRLRCKVSTPSTSSADTSQNANLKQMVVKTLQNINSQQKNASSALCEYMALELENLTPEQGACARAQLRRAFNDIMDQYSLMPPAHDELQKKHLFQQQRWDSNELSFIPKAVKNEISTKIEIASDNETSDEADMLA